MYGPNPDCPNVVNGLDQLDMDGSRISMNLDGWIEVNG